MTAADILDGLLRTNLAAGAAILGVVALRRTFRPRFGARLAYGLWLLPVLAAAAVLAPARRLVVAPSAAPAAVHLTALTPSSGTPAMLVAVWLVGVAAAALVMARLQHRFMRQAREGAVGPSVVGVIAPRIVTPGDFAERYSLQEQALVMAHERAHIARQDSRLNGLCAAAQCLCWFNPLVHLAARLMRIDQELACDEAVVARFPGARRAYAEVLMKAQLAVLPLPLGCYWPSRTRHPLVERVAMLKQKDIGRARRFAGVAALAILAAGAGLAAWAAQPADVRIAMRPSDGAPLARPAQAAVAANPVRIANGLAHRGPPELAATTVRAARSGVSPTPDRPVTGSAALSAAVQEIALLQAGQAPPDAGAPDAGRLRLAGLQTRQPDDKTAAPAAGQGAPQPAPGAMQVPASASAGPAAAPRLAAADVRKPRKCWAGRYGCAKEGRGVDFGRFVPGTEGAVQMPSRMEMMGR